MIIFIFLQAWPTSFISHCYVAGRQSCIILSFSCSAGEFLIVIYKHTRQQVSCVGGSLVKRSDSRFSTTSENPIWQASSFFYNKNSDRILRRCSRCESIWFDTPNELQTWRETKIVQNLWNLSCESSGGATFLFGLQRLLLLDSLHPWTFTN